MVNYKRNFHFILRWLNKIHSARFLEGTTGRMRLFRRRNSWTALWVAKKSQKATEAACFWSAPLCSRMIRRTQIWAICITEKCPLLDFRRDLLAKQGLMIRANSSLNSIEQWKIENKRNTQIPVVVLLCSGHKSISMSYLDDERADGKQ